MSAPPLWLSRLADEVGQTIVPADWLSPLGCHYHRAGEIWEVTLFASLTEVIGGDKDGAIVRSRFSVDLIRLYAIFTEVDTFHWQALPLGAQDELGPHVAVEGRYGAERVWLRVLARPPR